MEAIKYGLVCSSEKPAGKKTASPITAGSCWNPIGRRGGPVTGWSLIWERWMRPDALASGRRPGILPVTKPLFSKTAARSGWRLMFHRPDCKQVLIALVVAKKGIPLEKVKF